MRGKNFTVEILPRRIVSDDIFRRVRRTGNIIETALDTEYQARRKRTRGINFYDLGLYFETGETIYKSLVNDLVTDSMDLQISFEPIDDTDRENLVAEIEEAVFETPKENWKTVFSRIEKDSGFDTRLGFGFGSGEDFEAYLLSQFDGWTANGLKLTDEQLEKLYFFSDGLCFNPPQFVLDEAPPSGYKITSVYDSEADTVTFTPSNRMNVFLLPAINFTVGTAAYKNGLHTFDTGSEILSDLIGQLDYLNAFHSTFPRDLYLEYLEGINLEDAYINQYNAARIAAQLPDARAMRGIRDFAETPPYSYFSVYNPLAPADFPFSTIYTPTAIINDTHVFNEGFEVNIGGMNWKRLAMVIEKNAEYYYFWKTTHF